MTLLLHALAAVGAFLLFLLEPLIAKAILPWFGGSAGVWTTCMLFFQATLLAGYAYAHAASTRLRPPVHASLHAALLAASLVLLPIAPSEQWKPADASVPELDILMLLGASIGLPFFLLSATAPLLQVWAAHGRPGASPFRLYASSNFGSLLALPAYPFLVEPTLGIASQLRVWSAAYAAFAIALAVTTFAVNRSARGAASSRVEPSPEIATEPKLLWIALPACSSTLLLAVTNQLCQDLAPVPFLWLLPLAVYLVSFILAFASDHSYPRAWLVRSLLLVLAAMTWSFLWPSRLPLAVAVPFYSAGLFVSCMVCHGELARLRPAPSRLTSFYLASSTGGALGGVFVGVLAPRIFSGYWELLIGFAAIVPLALLAAAHDSTSPLSQRRPAVRRVSAMLGATLAAALLFAIASADPAVRVAVRNFYGVLRVADQEWGAHRFRTLIHGVTNHGAQFASPERRSEPTTYYGPQSGVGRAFELHHPDRPRRVGIVGLGAGTVALYGKPGDRLRFYEINPLVVDLARREFSFLAGSRAAVEVVLGDARLMLEREAPQQYDLLIVDAFSSGSIPIHLITREAFDLYLAHLAPDGLLAIHASNEYVDIEPVVNAAVHATGRTALAVGSAEDPARGLLGAGWILVGDEPALFANAEVRATSRPLAPRTVSWSDDHSSLFQVLR